MTPHTFFIQVFFILMLMAGIVTPVAADDSNTTATTVLATTVTIVTTTLATTVPTSGTIPLTIQFTDASTNTPTSWTWDYGDRRTSTVENPSYTYTTVGIYTVSLTAANSAGNNQPTLTDYIDVSAAHRYWTQPLRRYQHQLPFQRYRQFLSREHPHPAQLRLRFSSLQKRLVLPYPVRGTSMTGVPSLQQRQIVLQ